MCNKKRGHKLTTFDICINKTIIKYINLLKMTQFY
jgi:hypothetical protein